MEKNRILWVILTFLLIGVLFLLPKAQLDFRLIISILFTAVPSILIFFTLLEMIRQRKSSYMPDIMLGESPFFVYCKKNKNIYLPFIWTNHKVNKDDLVIEPLTVDSFNLGLGAAKYLEIKWDFDYDRLLKEIQKRDQNKIFRITNKPLIAIEIPKEDYSYCVDDLSDSGDYIIPTHIVNRPTKLSLPKSYLKLLSVLLYLSLGEKSEPDFPPERLPPLNLEIVYTDIGNNKHKKRFILYFCFRSITGISANKLDETVEAATGFICINKAREVGIGGLETYHKKKSTG